MGTTSLRPPSQDRVPYVLTVTANNAFTVGQYAYLFNTAESFLNSAGFPAPPNFQIASLVYNTAPVTAFYTANNGSSFGFVVAANTFSPIPAAPSNSAEWPKLF